MSLLSKLFKKAKTYLLNIFHGDSPPIVETYTFSTTVIDYEEEEKHTISFVYQTFPIEIWREICWFVRNRELLTLRATAKIFRDKIIVPPIWTSITVPLSCILNKNTWGIHTTIERSVFNNCIKKKLSSGIYKDVCLNIDVNNGDCKRALKNIKSLNLRFLLKHTTTLVGKYYHTNTPGEKELVYAVRIFRHLINVFQQKGLLSTASQCEILSVFRLKSYYSIRSLMCVGSMRELFQISDIDTCNEFNSRVVPFVDLHSTRNPTIACIWLDQNPIRNNILSSTELKRPQKDYDYFSTSSKNHLLRQISIYGILYGVLLSSVESRDYLTSHILINESGGQRMLKRDLQYYTESDIDFILFICAGRVDWRIVFRGYVYRDLMIFLLSDIGVKTKNHKFTLPLLEKSELMTPIQYLILSVCKSDDHSEDLIYVKIIKLLKDAGGDIYEEYNQLIQINDTYHLSPDSIIRDHFGPLEYNTIISQ